MESFFGRCSSCFIIILSIILQVNLPTDITQRYGHSATMFTGSNFRVVVLFGGKKTMSIGDVISETKLLFMCESIPFVFVFPYH